MLKYVKLQISMIIELSFPVFLVNARITPELRISFFASIYSK